MEMIDPAYAELLHEQGAKPYSQHVTSGPDNTLVWKVNALTDEAAAQLIQPLLRENLTAITLRQQQATLAITDRNIATLTHLGLMQVFYVTQTSTRLSLRFSSPTAFKQAAGYTFLPLPRLIFQNLAARYSAIVEDGAELDEMMVAEFESRATLSSYDIFTRKLQIGSTPMTGFMGRVDFSLHGPASLTSYLRMLARFGEFAGVGIKTAMGMGAMTIIPDREKRIQNES
jgi:CRISPR-associated endoribonuclease Cas6